MLYYFCINSAQRSPSGITPTVHNIISVADLGTKVNLKALSEKAINIKYNPRRFPAATFQLQVPKATVLVFSTGKILCTGANTEDNSKLASRKVAKTIHKLGMISQIYVYINLTNIKRRRCRS